jgi:hypothetical protein
MMNQQYTATLTAADVKRHIPHTFTVPDHCIKIAIRLHYTPRRVSGMTNLLTLTLFDPAGFRGAGHRGGDTHEVEITPTSATRGYLPGALPAGEWTVQIDTHMVLPGDPVNYTLDVTVECDPANTITPVERVKPDFSRVVNPNPGWYRGDLHSHTLHSDASWTTQELVAAARQQGLDFIALTDHNTISPLAEMAALGDETLLTLGGQELTTFWGHAVCLGAHEAWLDWRVDREGKSMATIATQLYEEGKLYIIAHPYAIGDPYCTGCRWLYTAMMPGTARLIEVWNGPWFGGHPLEHNCNEDGLAFYYRCLNEGRRLVMTAGSDAHGPKHYERGPGFNVVYAEALSEQGILRALAAGHSYLSVGPVLNLQAETDHGDNAMMGDQLPTAGQTEFTVLCNWSAAPAGATLRLIVNGAVYGEQEASETGKEAWRLPVYGTRWCTVELRGTNGTMLAVTNPVLIA